MPHADSRSERDRPEPGDAFAGRGQEAFYERAVNALSTTVARLAFVVHRDTPGANEKRLGSILTFFGVPWEPMSLADLAGPTQPDRGQAYAVLGSIETLAAALTIPRAATVLQGAAALYAYAAESAEASVRALSSWAGGDWAWRSPSTGTVSVDVTDGCPYLTGPMSGIQVDLVLGAEDGTVTWSEQASTSVVPIVSVNGVPAFLRFDSQGVPAYFCASTAIVDIDAPVRSNFYDVKAHFLAAVPLVMFVASVFRDVMWRPPELGACLIIDDPLLKTRYGLCDFSHLRESMKQHGFTTNIAFIPWNWRRTTRRASEFFRREANLFSVSIHGCDHVAAEFGSTSPQTLDSKARLAQARMQAHQQRTGIAHDPVMVFPQGVFSHECPPILKRNGYMAAVNTEIAPVNNGEARTAVRDVWDTAILSYGTFPIYTRRYAAHGIENFAFDLLLGKPCFIVAHHEFFRDRGAALIALVEKLSGLNCELTWRSPREVIQRAYRRRMQGDVERVEMYGSELRLTNDSERYREISVRKRESDPSLVESIAIDASTVESANGGGAVKFSYRLPPKSEALVTVFYRGNAVQSSRPASVKYQVAVAARRFLSEIRDEYVTPLLPARH